jgi:hypothetical protein
MSNNLTDEEFERIKNLKEGETYMDPNSNSYCGFGYSKYAGENLEQILRKLGSDNKARTCQFCKEESYYDYDYGDPCVFNTSICIKCHIGCFGACCSMIC